LLEELNQILPKILHTDVKVIVYAPIFPERQLEHSSTRDIETKYYVDLKIVHLMKNANPLSKQ
jgi:hypothetical protein